MKFRLCCCEPLLGSFQRDAVRVRCEYLLMQLLSDVANMRAGTDAEPVSEPVQRESIGAPASPDGEEGGSLRLDPASARGVSSPRKNWRNPLLDELAAHLDRLTPPATR